MKHRFSFSALLLVGTLLCCAPPSQAGLFSVSPEQEKKMGAEAARQIESSGRIVRGPVADWVNAVGQRLVATSNKEFEYSFRVIDNPEINAFALPGGYIYVFSGLRKVAQTDDELAAILAHEITHSEQHHFAKQYKKATTRGALLSVFSIAAGLPGYANQIVGLIDFSMTQKYSRVHEMESDKLGLERMVRAGFNPKGMETLLEKLAKENKSDSVDKWMGSHPDALQRATAIRAEIAAITERQRKGDPLVKPQFAPWTDATLQEVASTPTMNNASTQKTN